MTAETSASEAGYVEALRAAAAHLRSRPSIHTALADEVETVANYLVSHRPLVVKYHGSRKHLALENRMLDRSTLDLLDAHGNRFLSMYLRDGVLHVSVIGVVVPLDSLSEAQEEARERSEEFTLLTGGKD